MSFLVKQSRIFALAGLFITSVMFVVPSSYASEYETFTLNKIAPDRNVLAGIIRDSQRRFRSGLIRRADPSGGELFIRLWGWTGVAGCEDSFRVTWNFSPAIQYITPGDEFVASYSVERLESNCPSAELVPSVEVFGNTMSDQNTGDDKRKCNAILHISSNPSGNYPASLLNPRQKRLIAEDRVRHYSGREWRCGYTDINLSLEVRGVYFELSYMYQGQ